MKENKSKVIITSIVTVFPMVIGFLLWNRLPEKIATHFGSEGADEYKAVCSGDFPAHIISHPFVLPGCDLK